MTPKKLAAPALWSAAAFALSLAVTATPARAQATRTFVSTNGDDANGCTASLPCRTFAIALTKTAAGGEINCVDNGSYGPVTITKSITIDCTGNFAGITHSSVTGVIVNMPPGSSARLRGIAILGGPTASPGLRGIRMASEGSLTLEDIRIFAVTGGSGIEISHSSGTATVTLRNVSLADNGNGAGASIQVVPSGSGFVRLTMTDVHIAGTNGNAIRLDSTGTSNLGILTIMERVVVTNSTASGVSMVAGAGPAPFNVALINNSNLSNNGASGISTTGAAARARVVNTVVSLNGTGINPGTGYINNLGGNVVVGNSVDGAFN